MNGSTERIGCCGITDLVFYSLANEQKRLRLETKIEDLLDDPANFNGEKWDQFCDKMIAILGGVKTVFSTGASETYSKKFKDPKTGVSIELCRLKGRWFNRGVVTVCHSQSESERFVFGEDSLTSIPFSESVRNSCIYTPFEKTDKHYLGIEFSSSREAFKLCEKLFNVYCAAKPERLLQTHVA